MSKAKTYFEIVELRRSKELQAGIMAACQWMTENCQSCPLEKTPGCGWHVLPPASFDDNGDIKREDCRDLVFLHWIKEGKQK